MFSIAILIGIYSYIVFSLGLIGLFYKQSIILVTVIYLFLTLLLCRQSILKNIRLIPLFISQIRKSKLVFYLVLLIVIQALVNFIGVLGPEIAFDALWYHLTLPKIYLQNHAIIHIPGGLLYYSDMPKLIEMLYISALAFGNETLPKTIHFLFGILSVFAVYKLSRKFFPLKFSIISVAIFYSSLVVGWQSTTAYIDLARTFFEIMALWGFVNWMEKNDRKWLIESAVMLGLAASTKLLALGSFFIFTLLIIYIGLRNKMKILSITTNILVYWYIGMLIVLPWFVFSFVHTGNPIYPFFTNIYKVGFDIGLINPLGFVSDIVEIFTRASDPISPLYTLFFPLSLFFLRKFKLELKIVLSYSVFSILVWYITPRTGGGRFILPYLPAFSIICAGVIYEMSKLKKSSVVLSILFGLIIFISLASLIYRTAANSKYLPVILGKQTKQEFLTKHLNFSFGDFYDTDGFFKNHIEEKDTVLLYGFHNLYYVKFPFIDSSWVKKGDEFNYIAVQNSKIPQRFKYWNLVYYNQKTNVALYSIGGNTWVY